MTSTLVGKWLFEVERFHHEITGMPIPAKPAPLAPDRVAYGVLHLQEELNEFREAAVEGDIPRSADALVDLIYVAIGRLLEMGVAPGAAFEQAHLANMEKKQGEVPKRGNVPYDTVKPKGWRPPDLTPYLVLTVDDLNRALEQRELREVREAAPISVLVDLARASYHAQDTVSRERDAQGLPEPTDERPKTVPGDGREGSEAYRQNVAAKKAKPPLGLIPYEAEVMEGEVYGFGAKKYAKDGYKSFPYTYTELCSALKRHVGQFLNGEDNDPESGLCHIGHMRCCTSMLAWKFVHDKARADDRYRGPGSAGHQAEAA